MLIQQMLFLWMSIKVNVPFITFFLCSRLLCNVLSRKSFYIFITILSIMKGINQMIRQEDSGLPQYSNGNGLHYWTYLEVSRCMTEFIYRKDIIHRYGIYISKLKYFFLFCVLLQYTITSTKWMTHNNYKHNTIFI